MKSNSIEKVAVIGLGNMGHGIAQAFAFGGYEVFGYDEVKSFRDSAQTRIKANLLNLNALGLLPRREIELILSRIHIVEREEEAVQEVQFVTEAVREDLAIKQALFERIEKNVSPETIFASNSSTFPITQSALNLNHPERAIVTHWFNPPHIVPVVEIVPGLKTSLETTNKTKALLLKIGKDPILIRREIPGFLVNRVQTAMLREVWDLVDQGVASREDIDRAISGTLGFRLAAFGPLQISDFGGLDILRAMYAGLAPEIRSTSELPTVVKDLVEKGHYGVKTGEGFYAYQPEVIADLNAKRDVRLLALRQLISQWAQCD